MSIAFVRLGWISLLMTPSAVVLLVWIGVRGCGWPILVSICRGILPLLRLKIVLPILLPLLMTLPLL